MNQDQLNTTGSFNTTVSYLDKNNSVWSGVPAIVITVADVKKGIEAIDDAASKQQAASGDADDKTTVRHNFEEQILVIADQLAALAERNRDAILAAQVAFSISELDGLADDELEGTGKTVSGLGTANLAALADYGITAADVTALDALKVSFGKVKTAPRTAIAKRKGETDTLPGLISNVASILRRRLDKQMTMFRKSKPEFYAGYLAARVRVDRRAHRPAAKPTPAPTPPPA